MVSLIVFRFRNTVFSLGIVVYLVLLEFSDNIYGFHRVESLVNQSKQKQRLKEIKLRLELIYHLHPESSVFSHAKLKLKSNKSIDLVLKTY